MLNYWKDGKEIIVPSIGENGRVGQVLILGEKVEWGTGSFTSKNPLSKYPYLSVFTIVSNNELMDTMSYAIQTTKPLFCGGMHL